MALNGDFSAEKEVEEAGAALFMTGGAGLGPDAAAVNTAATRRQ